MSNENIWKYFVCGGVGGICNVLVGYPLDTIKVRLQTMPKPKPGEQPLYTGTLDCIKKTFAKEGIGGLYGGLGAPILLVAPICAMSFTGYGIGRQFLTSIFKEQDPLHYFASGCCAGFFAALIVAPGERIKCLLQTQQDSDQKLYKGPFDCAVKLYKQGGLRSIFKGTLVTILRDIPASGMYYLTYELIKNRLTNSNTTEMSVAGTIFAGGCAGVSNWLVGMPADVIKSRLQTARPGAYPNGYREIFSELLKADGILGLYKGITPVLLRTFPANAACFLGFDFCGKLIDFLST